MNRNNALSLKTSNNPAIDRWKGRSSIVGYLVGNLIVPLLYRRPKSLDLFRKAITLNRKDGPALPSARVKANYEVRELVRNGVRQFRVAPKLAHRQALRVLYIHGGAYVFDLGAAHWPLITGLVDELGGELCAPMYPLAPEATVEHGLVAVEAAFDELADEVGPGNVVVVGDSAGGGLALALCQRLRDRGSPIPGAAALLFPWLDVTVSGRDQPGLERIDQLLSIEHLRYAGILWAGDSDPATPPASPLFGDLRGLPPTFVLVGTKDLLLSDTRRFADRCPEAVISEYPGMFHGWVCAPIAEARHALHQIGKFVQHHIG